MAAAYFLVTGLGFLVSTGFYEKIVRGIANADPVSLNLSGAVHILVGLAIVLQHIRWGSLLEIFVTLIGLAAMLKGAALIAVPEWMLRLPKTKRAALRMSGVAFAALSWFRSVIVPKARPYVSPGVPSGLEQKPTGTKIVILTQNTRF